MTYEMYTHFYPAARISQLFYPLAVKKNLHQNHLMSITKFYVLSDLMKVVTKQDYDCL